jgi:plastocyanin/uncharacterized membrane protein YozB (DUF420 family)
MLKESGFLGTGATLGADLTLMAQIFMYIALCLGIVAQRRGLYKWHDRIQTPVVVLNFVFIIFVMMASFREQAVASTLPQRPRDPYYLSAAVHGAVGLLAQGLAVYALLAGYKILPRKIGRLRYWMWATFAAWTLAVVLGFGTYYNWYIRDGGRAAVVIEGGNGDDQSGAATVQRLLLQNFAFAPSDVTVVAGSQVIWLNQDGAPHNVTLDDTGVASPNFFQGETFALTFDTPGVFGVHCTLHGNPGSGMAATVRVVEATAENITAVAAQPTPAPQPPAPTPLPPLPPPPLAPLEAAVPPQQQLAGLLFFRDTHGPSDTAVLDLSRIDPAPAGQGLTAWLTNRDNELLNIGPIFPDGEGRVHHVFVDPTRQNLLANYDGVQITLEPAEKLDSEPGEVVYSGRQAATALAHIRTITVRALGPTEESIAVAARLQAEELIRHAEFVELAFELLSIADAQRHAEHMINIIEGEQGQHYGDHDQKHGIQNPGDGFGLLTYLQAMDEAAERAAAADDATSAIKLHAGHVTIATANVRQWVIALRQAALEVIDARRIGEIGPQVEALNRYSHLLLLGHDPEGHLGFGEVPPQNGGILTAYQHAQYMAAIAVATGADTAVVDPELVVLQATPALVPGGEAVLSMLDFDYGPRELRVPSGTAVRFINAGQARHSATADEGHFDTGLLGSGQEFTFTFNAPGTYAYFCLLHGLPGGNGMSGIITVDP